MKLVDAIKECYTADQFNGVRSCLSNPQLLENAAIYCFTFPNEVSPEATRTLRVAMQHLRTVGVMLPLQDEIN